MPQIVTTSSRKGPPRRTALPAAIATAFLIVAAVAYFTISNRGASTPQPPAPPVLQPSNPSTASQVASTGTQSADSTPSSAAQSASPDASAPSDAPASQSDNTPTNEPPRAVNVIWPRKPTGFNGGSVEQILGMMVSAGSASGMPPIPMGSEESMLKDFMVAVTNDIVIFEDDDEYTVKFKEQVADFKNQLMTIVEQGGSITNALKEYERWINESQTIRREVTAEYKRLKVEASQEEADEYLAVANKELEAEGIPTVNLGKERKRNRARRDAREAAALKAIEEARKANSQKGTQP